VTQPAAAPPRASYLIPAFGILAMIWGTSFLFIKVGVRELHPMYVTLSRVALGALTILILLAVLRQKLPRDPRIWAHLAVAGAIGVALPFTLYGYGEQRVPSLLAGIWNATTPLATLPLAVLLFRTERFTARSLTGLGIGFVGVLVVLGVWTGVGGSTFTGQLLCFAAATCYSVAIPYMKRFVTDTGTSELALVAGQMLAATAMMAVIAPLAAGAPPAPASLSPEVIGSMVALGALGTGIAFVIHMRNIRLVGATAASLVTYVSPVCAVLAGVVVLGESLAWYQPVGGLVVLLGVAISQSVLRLPRRPRSRPKLPTPEETGSHPAAADGPGPAVAGANG
jgi:drug/metabolite transporter (DMT)-like permease